jgi:hypothetical protein
MDFTSDYSSSYWTTINREINHTRCHCIVCGRRRPRHELHICEECPGSVCDGCQEWHDRAAAGIHRKATATTVTAIPIDPKPATCSHPTQIPSRPRFRQTKLHFSKLDKQ